MMTYHPGAHAEKERERQADLKGIDDMLDLEARLHEAADAATALVCDGWGDIAKARDLITQALEIVQNRRRIAERLTP